MSTRVLAIRYSPSTQVAKSTALLFTFLLYIHWGGGAAAWAKWPTQNFGWMGGQTAFYPIYYHWPVG